MTYGEVKRMALRLIFSDTAAGQPIAESYNDQADYLAAIPALVDSAQTDIAVRARRIPALCPVDSLSEREEGGFRVLTLPADCREPMHGGLLLPEGEEFGRCRDYRLAGGRLWLPKSAPAGLILEYWRYPVSVGASPEDALELDNTPDVHAAIPFFVAAQLVLYDDSYRYAVLRSEYESRVAALRESARVEESTVGDVYGFDGFREVEL